MDVIVFIYARFAFPAFLEERSIRDKSTYLQRAVSKMEKIIKIMDYRYKR